eukprot:1451271-Prymnesium_polylepis.1
MEAEMASSEEKAKEIDAARVERDAAMRERDAAVAERDAAVARADEAAAEAAELKARPPEKVRTRSLPGGARIGRAIRERSKRCPLRCSHACTRARAPAHRAPRTRSPSQGSLRRRVPGDCRGAGGARFRGGQGRGGKGREEGARQIRGGRADGRSRAVTASLGAFGAARTAGCVRTSKLLSTGARARDGEGERGSRPSGPLSRALLRGAH